MKNLIMSIAAFAALQFSASAQTSLFNGKNIDGWHIYLKSGHGAWSVADGAIQLDPNAEGQGDLVTDKEYTNYELSLEWKIAPGGNSGIIFGVHEDPKYGATYLTGIEMQVLDNKDAEDNKNPTHLAGSLYDMKQAAATPKPAGEWNKVKLRKLNGHLTFWMNGKISVDTQIGSPEWNAMLAKSKFKDWKGFAEYPYRAHRSTGPRSGCIVS